MVARPLDVPALDAPLPPVVIPPVAVAPAVATPAEALTPLAAMPPPATLAVPETPPLPPLGVAPPGSDEHAVLVIPAASAHQAPKLALKSTFLLLVTTYDKYPQALPARQNSVRAVVLLRPLGSR